MISELCDIEFSHGSVNLEDFNVICRICLKNQNEMVDIFRSGMYNQIMEVTNIKISSKDGLPKRVCQECNFQVTQFQKFLDQAKLADKYLKSLLTSGEEHGDIENSMTHNLKKKFQRRKKKNHKVNSLEKSNEQRKKRMPQDEKMYLIVVPSEKSEVESCNEICIKDLNVEKDNNELTNFCHSVVRRKFLDHTYPKEEPMEVFSNSDNNFKILKEDLNEKYKQLTQGLVTKKEESIKGKNFYVNLFIYSCSECKECFETEDKLIGHTKLTHGNDELLLLGNSPSYICPVCSHYELQKNSFMEHLKRHKENGVTLVKVGTKGENLDILDSEEDIFTSVVLMNHVSNEGGKIYKLFLGNYICSICEEVNESLNDYFSHMELIHNQDLVDTLPPSMKYTCPICFKIWIDNRNSFVDHLLIHKSSNTWFIKVDQFGRPMDLNENESAFTPLQEAINVIQLSKTDCGQKNISEVFKNVEELACNDCNYKALSFFDLKIHYLNFHDKKFTFEKNFECPMCEKNFDDLDPDERRSKLYSHLKEHPENLEIKHDFKVIRPMESEFLINETELMEIDEIWTPEVVISIENKIEKSDKYNCDLCGLSFKTKRQVSSHLKGHETNANSHDYVCEKCGKKCVGRANYNRHYSTHCSKIDGNGVTPKRPKCELCDKTFTTRSILREHLRQHEESEKEKLGVQSFNMICEICGRRFSNTSSLTKHKKLHSTNKENSLFKCEICERDFCRESSYNRHVSAHLNPNYFECEICKLPLPSLGSFQKHSEMHQLSSTTFDCKVCKLSFLSKDGLTGHQTHTGHHQDREPFECNVCHEKFYVGKKFAQHIKIHPKYKMSECTLCGKKLSTVQSLMLHMGRHFESNSILCPHCGKQFFEERNYHRHLLTHQGIKPFSCDVKDCGKSFYTLFEIKRHKKYHNNTRDFTCPHCSKSFHESNHLKVHVRTHTGERPYTCPHCTKGFVTRTRCKQHIKLIHQGVGYELIQSSISKKVAVFETIESAA